MPDTPTVPAPELRDVTMHAYKPNEPGQATIVRNEICTATRKAAGFVRHVEIDVSGTALEGLCVPGQSIGIIPPGEDDKGRPHAVRLYSLANPSRGEDGQGKIVSTTVKRTIDEHWDSHKLFLGVASNYLCDAQEGDTVLVTGPAGKRFVLPKKPEDHSYLFFATGTGIAPYRGMIMDLIETGVTNPITLVMGAPYHTDLIYHDELRALEAQHESFHYITALSREKQDDGHDRMYVQERLQTHRDQLGAQIARDDNLIYVCGIAGMELGIFRALADDFPEHTREQYLHVDPEILDPSVKWNRKMLHKKIKHTKRVFLEVYA
jgi:ferredoxin--NADP+ reductase